MQATTRQRLVIPVATRPTDADGDLVLSPGESVAIAYRHDRRSGEGLPRRFALRIVGEAGLAWRERCEPEQPLIWYRSIEDALRRDAMCGEEYSLVLEGRGEPFERNAFFRIPSNEIPRRCKSLEFSVQVRPEGLRIDEGGWARAALEIYHHKGGRHGDDVYEKPDRVVALDVASGTRGWTTLSKRLTGIEKIASILVRVGGYRFRGLVRFATPQLVVPGEGNLISPFRPESNYHPHRNWLGENLSRKEWPEFRLTVNRREVFRGPVFCPIVRDPDVEFAIPEQVLKAGVNRLELTLLADYPTAPVYVLRRAEMVSQTARDFEIAAVPEYGVAGQTTPILVEVNRPTVTLRASTGETFKLERGLGVVHLSADQLAERIELTDGKRSETVSIERTVVKGGQDVLLGTGDAVYVPQTVEAFGAYLKWYMAHRIGNFVTFRPVYRWCGSRVFDREAWTFARGLLDRLGVRYAHMVDGRELPGKDVNPPVELLAGPNFVGRQSHECDGAFNYWGSRTDDPLFGDIFHRSKDPDGIEPGVHPVREQWRYFLFQNTVAHEDMRTGAQTFVERLRYIARYSTRHTGPSALFRYFYQAGLEFLGAETMYSAEDVVLASVRGAARAYGKSEFGAHLAVQWSSTPLDDPAHFRRYFLSLACCYLQGVTQINTEEGLYRMENLYAREDRFGAACSGHREAHAIVRRFIETHERRGTLRAPIGVLQGRDCGWTCFARGRVWAQEAESMRFGPPEESFDLLKVFYPRCRLDGIYRSDCPQEPQGWYSGTPYGPVDLLPVEAPLRVLRTYKALAFLGWNTFQEKDFAALLEYVRAGGTLLLARPHVSINTKRFEPSNVPSSKSLRQLLGEALRAGGRVERAVGRGRVIFYGQDLYPADAAVRRSYENDLRTVAKQQLAEERRRGWIEGSEDTDFAVYDAGDLRIAYLLNVAWWDHQSPSRARLLLQEKSFPLTVPFGRIQMAAMVGPWALVPENSDVDIVEAAGDEGRAAFLTQADGPSVYTVCCAEAPRKVIVSVDGKVVPVERVSSGRYRFTASPGSLTISV